ncbi:MAG: prolipoprotein diacylglyceryl transferase [Myxococcales bacterium]|nr:prolipoprotein diacylglyceryl transferase [Myxococcales bacterium]
MIPYIHVPDLPIGPIKLHPFGLLVATGVIVGSILATRRARARGVDVDKLNSFITWMLISGFVLSHMIDEVFYHPEEIKKAPWTLLMPWTGLSSFGGFIGGLIGVVTWKFIKAEPLVRVGGLFTIPKFKLREKAEPIMPLCDIILAVFPVAWIFGRSGCSVVHDHPGMKAGADALLAVAYGPYKLAEVKTYGPIELRFGSQPQYDLGLMELMFTVLVAAFFAATWSRRLPTGSYIAATAFAYAPVRFVMDFFRIREGDAADLRYGQLTFAQWCCVALFVFGGVMSYFIWNNVKKGVDPIEAHLRRSPPRPAAADPPLEEA